MKTKSIISFGKPSVLACDGKCNKAFGLNNRPKIQLDQNNDDDICWLSDSEVGEAPADPGTYEGFEMCGKPKTDADKLNKWCARECERSVIIQKDAKIVEIALPNWDERLFNIPRETPA